MIGWILATLILASATVWLWLDVHRLQEQLDTYRERAAKAAAALEPVADALEAEKQRGAEMLNQLLTMRREGFAPPDTPDDFDIGTYVRLPGLVMEALNEIAAPGTPLYAQESQLAQQQIEDGADPEKVADQIRQGGTYEPWT